PIHITSHPHIPTLSLHDALPICIARPHHGMAEAIGCDRKLNRDKGIAALRCIMPNVRDLARPADHLIVSCLAQHRFEKVVQHDRSEEHTSELQSPYDLVCRLLLE